MKFRNFLSSSALGAVAVGMAVGALGIGPFGLGSTTAVAQDKVTWHLSAWGNPREVTSGFERIAEYVAEKTDGNFTIKLHYGETISPAQENLDGIKIGSFEMAMTCTAYHPGKNPLFTVLDLPFLPIPDVETQGAVQEALFDHPAIQAEMKRWGALPYFGLVMPPYEFMGKGDAPKGLEGWEGMRLRALGGLGDAMKQLGAVPTTLPAPEVYTGLERGTIDAASFAYYAHGAYGLHEISDWYTYGMAIGSPNCPLVVGIAAWESLPEEYRALLEEAKSEGYQTQFDAYAKAREKWLPVFDEEGVERLTYTPEVRQNFADEAAKPVWDAWIEKMSSKGPAQELLDFVIAEANKANGF